MTDENPEQSKLKIIDIIEETPDPRLTRCKKHPLVSVVFITLVTGLCGANNCVEVESMGEGLHDWIAHYVPLPNGIPAHDTFGRVFSLISPKAFREFFERWICLVRDHLNGEVVSLDGKNLEEDKRSRWPLHLLNAWSIDSGICLGQLPVDKKTNEITIFI